MRNALFLFLFLWGLCLQACGLGLKHSETNSDTTTDASLGTAVDEPLSQIPFHVYLLPGTSAKLNLTNADLSFDGSVSGCVSGFSSTFTDDTSINLYTHDHGCVARLSAFTIAGETFAMADANFNTGTGQLTLFNGDQGGYAQVLVLTQLSNNIDPVTDSVDFNIIQIAKAADVIVSTGKNIVTLRAEQTTVDEVTAPTMQFTVFKVTEANQNALTVHLSFAGTAESGTDYTDPGATVVIPANQTSVVLNIATIHNPFDSTPRSITVSIADDAAYDHFGSAVTAITSSDVAPGDPGYTTVTDIAGWLLGDRNITLTDNKVAAWTDHAGVGASASQSTAGLRPGVDLSDYGVTFNGTTQYLSIAGNSLLNTGGPYSQKTFALAFKTSTDVTTRQVLYEQGDDSRGFAIYIDQGQIYFVGYNTVNDGADSPWGPTAISANISTSTVYTVVFEFDHDTCDCVRGTLDGTSIGSTIGTGLLYSHGTNNIGVGAEVASVLFHDSASSTGTGTYPFKGKIYEMIMYNTLLSAGNLSTLVTYLTGKY